jgi:TolB protein
MMFGKRKKESDPDSPVPVGDGVVPVGNGIVPADDELVPVLDELPALEGPDGEVGETARRGSRIGLGVLLVLLAGVLLVVCALVAGGLGVYDGLKDRAIANRQLAQEHYALGLAHLEARDYELAIAEFELAMRYNSNLPDLGRRLQETKELALAQLTPTSETRLDAATLLYRQAVPHYEGGNLAQAVAVLEELRGLDPDYQHENVTTMLTTAHYQLGLNAVQENRLDEANEHFEAVLVLNPEDEKAQDQLNLLNLYAVALNHWETDWSATIQALKGLYSLAPDYKDVRTRLHNAHVFRAEAYADKGDWCRASDDYAGAVEVFPLEATVDKRDDAAIRCQATAEAPTPAPTARVTARPTTRATAAPQATPMPTAPVAAPGKGRIAFASYDGPRQRFDIYLVDPGQGNTQLLRGNASQPAFNPGGDRLVFHNHDPSHLGLDIVDLRSHGTSELTAYAEDSTPAWSPDAKQIVFASDKHGDRKWRIYVISPGEIRGEGVMWAFGQMPTWSPDSSQVAYHGCDERGDNCGVWVMKAGGFSPARLTTDPGDTAPSWSPDGSQVAFISARSGNWELYLVNVTTGQETQITEHPAADVAPAWSPDGRRLAFLSNRDGTWALYVLDVASGQIQKVIDTGDAYPDPVSERLSWLP